MQGEWFMFRRNNGVVSRYIANINGAVYTNPWHFDFFVEEDCFGFGPYLRFTPTGIKPGIVKCIEKSNPRYILWFCKSEELRKREEVYKNST